MTPLARWTVLLVGSATTAWAAPGPVPLADRDGGAQRVYLVEVLGRIADPVLIAGSEGRLKTVLPKMGNGRDEFAPLEALGRTLAGIAPWIELGPGPDAEGVCRARAGQLARAAIARGVDPASPAFLDFNRGSQPLVDAAFLAQALLRAPRELWAPLPPQTKSQLIAALKSSRVIVPPPTNWELFSATVEAALLEFSGEAQAGRIDRAVRDHLAWYKGDGVYGDGAYFHFDYYNSYVIQPMLIEVLKVAQHHHLAAADTLPLVRRRLQRYAEIQERTISPEATFPIVGRSSTYRFGAFQALAECALRRELPERTPPGAVRAALAAVIQRMIEAPGTFDDAGWLNLGAVGAQPGLAETYISRGSPYLCTEALLILGLPANDPFWTAPSQPWTQRRLWAGENLPADHALPDTD